jgi:hypothetical protein
LSLCTGQPWTQSSYLYLLWSWDDKHELQCLAYLFRSGLVNIFPPGKPQMQSSQSLSPVLLELQACTTISGLTFNFVWSLKLFSIMSVSFNFTNSVQGFSSLYTVPTLISCLFDKSHSNSNRCEMAFHCVFFFD